MSSRFDIIAQLIFKKPLAQCSIAELEKLGQEYPAFAAAHFLRAKAELQSHGLASKAYFQKAALYHHQPTTFEAFLADNEMRFDTLPAEDFDDTSAGFVAAALAADEPAPVLAQEQAPATGNAGAAAEAYNAAEAETNQPQAGVVLPPTEDDAAENTSPGPEAGHRADAAPAVEESAATAPQPAAQQEAEVKEHELVSGIKPQSAAAPEPPAFEPFHTVDYFASQGIKLSQSGLPKDKFGKQVMSFTAWLKTMKRLPASEQIKSLDPQQEQKVEHLAAHSIEGHEVVTETMAEVWLKQGATEKAAEVYRKLSLLHPGKSAYFAAKLQQIK